MHVDELGARGSVAGIVILGKSRKVTAILYLWPTLSRDAGTLHYNDHEGLHVHDVETLIVNRDLADWVRADPGDLTAFEGVPVASSTG